MKSFKEIRRKILILRKFTWFNILLKPYHFYTFFKKYKKNKNSGELTTLIHKFIQDDLSRKEERDIQFDILLSNILYGSSINNYFEFDFFYKPRIERKGFITNDMEGRYFFAFNPPKYQDIFDDKYTTYQIFRNYINREFLLVSGEVNLETFTEFCQRNKEIFIKTRYGSWGEGAKRIQINNFLDIKSLYHICLQESLILEGVIVQHPSLAEFHPNSLNTLRIITVVTKEGVKIMKPLELRMGNNGKIVDNFQSGGIVAEIDLDTGKITYFGVDKFGNEYEEHPFSHKKIVGFQIPFWDETVKFVKDLALVVPECRLVGWDIALSNRGFPILVEGNAQANIMPHDKVKTKTMFEEALRNI